MDRLLGLRGAVYLEAGGLNMGGFTGAKIALFIGPRLAVILRDDRPGLIFADHWDFPGGGREGGEGPFACAQRECREELGLTVPQSAVVWQRAFEERGEMRWFFVAELAEDAALDVRFGDEGQTWTLMTPEEYLSHPKGIPPFQDRLRMFLRERNQGPDERPPAALSGGR
ncbi:MAG: NUDIX domain-containing protein [Pseudomonadota bacterium]